MASSEVTDRSEADATPLSLKRLTAAFAQMLGPTQRPHAEEGDEPAPAAPDPCEISPRSIVEGVLFVGATQGGSRSAEQLAAAMRDVTPEEIRQAIDEMNEVYERDAAPYSIVQHDGGYRLELRPEMTRMRDKFHGRVKETKLAAAAMEVLSIVAYKQPITLERVDKLRGAGSRGLLASLVRRGLVRFDRPSESDGVPDANSPRETHYQTTERFLRVFGLEKVDQLPRAAEMEE